MEKEYCPGHQLSSAHPGSDAQRVPGKACDSDKHFVNGKAKIIEYDLM